VSERATATFDLPGVQVSRVRCTACANRVCETLGTLPGVMRVDCDTVGGAVRVEFDPARITEADLAVETERFGLELADTLRHATWRVTGLD
jgi:copper chaperone CopZ